VLTVSVRSFGPIEEASVELRPLTILVGPNNAGKSYFATLVYALAQASAPWGFRFGPRPAELNTKDSGLFAEWTQIATTLHEHLAQSGSEHILVANLPEAIQNFLDRLTGAALAALGERFRSEVERCFGLSEKDLDDAKRERLTVDLIDPDRKLRLPLINRIGRVAEYAVGELTLQKTDWLAVLEWQAQGLPPHFALSEIQSLLAAAWLMPLAPRPAYYFPASRSGVLQGHRVLAASLIRSLPVIGLRPLAIPQLPGVVADFLSWILLLEPQRRWKGIVDIAEFLETNVCQGRLVLESKGEMPYPEFIYRYAGMDIPLHRASSAVSELAPIVLFLKYMASENDLLIIEEPEAHLHPDNQLRIARAFARLVRRGVWLLVTTHSDYFLHQISNLIRLSLVRERARALGYGEDEYLEPEEVAAYLFQRDLQIGTRAQPLTISATDGIPEDEFVRIAEALYSETLELEAARRPRS